MGVSRSTIKRWLNLKTWP
ncbi:MULTISPECIES: hypothetical protein [Enterobacteriaceae]